MTNSTPSSSSHKQTHVLLSIRPEFVKAIFSGKKQYEFRRRMFSKDVDVVVVYSTLPTGSVVGEFDVAGIIKAPIRELWRRTQRNAGITEELFSRYFSGRKNGYAIGVGSIRRYSTPFDPTEAFGLKPPQSFAYIEHSDLHSRSNAY